METQADDSADEINESEGENLQGFRFVDICVLASANGELFLLKKMKSLRWA